MSRMCSNAPLPHAVNESDSRGPVRAIFRGAPKPSMSLPSFTPRSSNPLKTAVESRPELRISVRKKLLRLPETMRKLFIPVASPHHRSGSPAPAQVDHLWLANQPRDLIWL